MTQINADFFFDILKNDFICGIASVNQVNIDKIDQPRNNPDEIQVFKVIGYL